jgi:16S rRNA (adenine1518-N6/adenine1519-N6)-dimethyltransferase
MNPLIDPDYIKRQLGGRRPNEFFGQNFLVDEEVLSSIVKAGEIKKTDTILEIGPGLGVLTLELAARAKAVIAVEKDRNLIPALKRNLKEFKNLTVLNDDILKLHLEKYITGPYKVIANIPYYLSSHLFQYLLNLEHKPDLIVLLVQKEVGERIVALPGKLSILGISVQIKADASVQAFVPRQSFWPVPKVDSVIITIKPKNKYPQIDDEKLFFRIVKIAFASKRKQIHNTLKTGLKLSNDEVKNLLDSAQIGFESRPQELALNDWIQLYKIVKQNEKFSG